MSLPDVDHTFLCLWHVWIRSEIHHFYAEKWKHVVIQLLTFGRSDINQIRIDVSFMDLLFLYVGLNILFSSNHNRLKGLKHKNKGHTNFYECCDLTEKLYLRQHTLAWGLLMHHNLITFEKLLIFWKVYQNATWLGIRKSLCVVYDYNKRHEILVLIGKGRYISTASQKTPYHLPPKVRLFEQRTNQSEFSD